jgi:hypothetical protein
LRSTDPLEQTREDKRRADVVGIFPNEAITRLIGAVLVEQSDECLRVC